jgi:hypothetical protein
MGLQQQFEASSGDFKDDMRALLPVARGLFDTVYEFDRAYAREKRRRNLCDFSDLEHFALRILAETDEKGGTRPTELARLLGARYREIMVDEYQDINEVQELIVSCLSRGNVFMVGQPLGVIRSEGFVRCGISPDDAVDGVNLPQACGNAPHGALYIDDGNHCNDAGMPCEDTKLRILGDPNPRWTGGVTSTLKWHKLSLGTQVDVRHGGLVWNGTKGALWSYGTHADTKDRATCVRVSGTVSCTGNEHAFGESDWYPGAVVGPGAGQKIPIGENWFRLSNLAACPFTGIDEPCLENAGFVKLREVSLAYTFDQPWVSRLLGLSTMNIRVAGRNLKTWTKYTGLDPETTAAGPFEQVGAADYFNLPLTRSFVVTVNLNR